MIGSTSVTSSRVRWLEYRREECVGEIADSQRKIEACARTQASYALRRANEDLTADLTKTVAVCAAIEAVKRRERRKLMEHRRDREEIERELKKEEREAENQGEWHAERGRGRGRDLRRGRERDDDREYEPDPF